MVVGVTGLAGSGKSTVVNMMLELVPGARAIAFAEPLKQFCAEVYNWPLEKFEDQAFKATPDRRYVRLDHEQINVEGGGHRGDELRDILRLTPEELQDYEETGVVHLTPRHALQQLGTNWGRGCWEHTWIALAMRRITDLRAVGCPLVIVSDVRFDNETTVMDKVIEVVRPGVERGTHASEAGISPELVWAKIGNNGGLQDLHRTILGLLPLLLS